VKGKVAVTKRERAFATIERKAVDRPAKWLGMPVSESYAGLFEEYGVNNYHDLKLAVDDDIWEFDIPYCTANSDSIGRAFDFLKDENGNTLTGSGFFEEFSDGDDISVFNWPDPAQHIDKEECRRRLEAIPSGYATMGVVWSSHFQDACAAFGMESALMKMKTDPLLFKEIIDRIVDFYLKANQIFYEAVDGKLDFVLLGNDFGTQDSLICSPDDLREFVFGGTKALIDQAHSYGIKVVHHSCGAVRPVINDITACGADVIHPIQALAKGMEPQGLKTDFGDTASFCGGVDTQELLVNAAPEEVEQVVKRLKHIFPTGLIISPSHEALLPDAKPENIRAMML